MPHAVSGSAKAEVPTYKTKGEKLTKAIVIEEVKVIEVPRIYEVPVIKNVEKEQTKYITKVEIQTKFNTVEEETVKYVPREQDTTKYNTIEKETTKYSVREVEVEKPIPIDKPYERPRIIEKEYTIATIKDMENVRMLMDAIPKITETLKKLEEKLSGLRDYKLVEEVKKVPKLEYIPTTVERIVWKDVERERPK